jgi:hypothetical protein
MGETATDTRQEIERTRRELGSTLARLRTRTLIIRGHIIRVVAIAGATVGVAGVGASTFIVLRRRRGGAITRAAAHLPNVPRNVALPVARTSDRWLSRRAESARRRREQIVDDLAARIADQQAQAQRRANPLWRRAASTALETAASVGVAALVRRAMSEPVSRSSDVHVRSADDDSDGVGPGSAAEDGTRRAARDTAPSAA